MKAILLVCDLEHIRDFFEKNLSDSFAISHTFTLDIDHLEDDLRFDYIFLDLQLLNQFKKSTTKGSYRELIDPIRTRFPYSIIVIMSDSTRSQDAVRAIKSGADNYLNYPLNTTEISYILENEEKIQENAAELSILKDQFWREYNNFTLKTRSSKFKEVLKQIDIVAKTKSTVLLTGETGTGKGVVAKIIHKRSQRKKSKYVQVHCGAIPHTLIESELFGHEKGAFTGADKRKLGKFELANGGTIFLDEIGTVGPQVQISLLKILQERTFSRIGGEQEITTDIRVIAATNENLMQLSDEKAFRKDLYYRLNVFPIELPPLRERIEDIPLFVTHFIDRFNREHQKNIDGVEDGLYEILMRYSWPGNIRELENVIERAYILESSSTLTAESLPLELLITTNDKSSTQATLPLPECSAGLAEARKNAIELFERNYLKQLLSDNQGKVNKSAEQAGISTRQLRKLMLKHDIDKTEFKNKNN